MADEASDPKIVDRLKKLPPFDEEDVPQVAPQTLTDPTEPVEPAPEPTTEEFIQEEGRQNLIKKVFDEGSPPPPPATPEEEEARKRTQEQFDKLKEHNAELKKKLDEIQIPKKNALDALYPESPVTNVIPTTQQYPTLAPKEIKDTFANLTDDQGYVDTGLLKETLTNLQKAKEDAEKIAKDATDRVQKVERRQDDFERGQAMKEVHKDFPKLNPDNATSDDPALKFDNRFYEQFQKELMYQWSTKGTADPMDVARKASDIIYGADMRKADKEKIEAAELAKRNINATSVKPASTVSSYKDNADLILATRKGSHSALLERLNKIGQ
jgi:hypothetical protein